MMLQIVIGLILVESSTTLAGNVLQAGEGGIMKNQVSTRTKLTYEDTCFLAEAKTKTVRPKG
jgi:hypothetical protein